MLRAPPHTQWSSAGGCECPSARSNPWKTTKATRCDAVTYQPQSKGKTAPDAAFSTSINFPLMKQCEVTSSWLRVATSHTLGMYSNRPFWCYLKILGKYTSYVWKMESKNKQLKATVRFYLLTLRLFLPCGFPGCISMQGTPKKVLFVMKIDC